MSAVAVRAENLGKLYRVGGPRAAYGSLRESLVDAAQTPIRALRGGLQRPETFWALKDVAFDVGSACFRMLLNGMPTHGMTIDHASTQRNR